MPVDRGASTNGRTPGLKDGVGASSELDGLRATCRPAVPSPVDADAATDRAEVRLALDASAPAMARAFVADTLGDGWAGPALDRAQLATSELVTNAVVHSGASADTLLVFRLERSRHAARLEVEDSGRGGAVARREPDLAGGGGFGLNLVQHVSERWGMEHVAGGGTRVWACIALPPLAPVG